MRRLWLVFAQAVTVSVAVLFVLTTLKPEWIDVSSRAGSIIRVIEPMPAPLSESPPRSDSYADAAARSMPAVVHIYTTKDIRSQGRSFRDDPLLRRFFGNPDDDAHRQSPSGLGSGVIVSPDGLILTNNHVIETADEIEVALNDGRKFRATLVGRDPESDLAVLKANNTESLPSIVFSGGDTLRVGDVVLAIGNPFGVGQTVTMGIVSALDRSRLGINTFENYIQTDAAINPGNSGGALVDGHGNLVGINTAIYSRSGGSLGIGFAIPASTARNVLEQIVAAGEVTRGWIGVEIQELNPDLAASFGLDNTDGALIAGVLRGSPADRAGIKPGDILVRLNGAKVGSAAEMLKMVAAIAPGQESTFRVRRGGMEVDLQVAVGRRPIPALR